MLVIGLSLEDMEALFAQPVVKTVFSQMKGKNFMGLGGNGVFAGLSEKEKELEVSHLEKQ